MSPPRDLTRVTFTKVADEDNKPSLDVGALAHKLRSLGEGTPEREAYLERLREQVRTGAYKVDSGKLAEKLIRRLHQKENDV